MEPNSEVMERTSLPDSTSTATGASSWPSNSESETPSEPTPVIRSLFAQAFQVREIIEEEDPPQRLGPRPDCDVCGGHGWVRRNVPTDHPDFGKAFPCACAEPIFRQHRLDRIFGKAQIPDEEFGKVSFSTYALLPDGDQMAREMVEQWASDGEGSVFLWGNVGRGKTGLGICALRHRVEVQGCDALYRYVPELLDDIRRGFDRDLGGLSSGEILDAIRETNLVLLDDVGKENPTPWVRETFHKLIDYRWRHHLPTIFTSNDPLTKLEGRMGEAVASRVKAMCWPNVLEVQGDVDLR
jgi:DNA replication protein DnaC